MQAIILLAGKGSRMGDLTKNTHKSLIDISANESFLSRLMHQLNEYSFSKIVAVTGYRHQQVSASFSNYQLNIEIVRNENYEIDTNIISIKLAMDALDLNETTIILEGDIWLDDVALKEVYEQSKNNNSIWFTKGDFNDTQRGGIIKINEQKIPTEILVVKKFEEKYNTFKKMTGIMTIGSHELKNFYELVKEQVDKKVDQYFFIPWVKNLSNLKSYIYDLNPKNLFSANTIEELQILQESYKYLDSSKIELIQVDKLSPIEDYIKERYNLVLEKIKKEDVWAKPIVIEDEHNLVLDGHHRFEVAKSLNLKVIPAIKVKYKDIPIWSLRPEEEVNHELVVSRALENNIYPNKTVKHSFPFHVPSCEYPLASLM